MPDEDDDREWWDYESGPFCRHWGELGYCEKPCPTCGHACNEHRDDTACMFTGCSCAGWPKDDPQLR